MAFIEVHMEYGVYKYITALRCDKTTRTSSRVRWDHGVLLTDRPFFQVVAAIPRTFKDGTIYQRINGTLLLVWRVSCVGRGTERDGKRKLFIYRLLRDRELEYSTISQDTPKKARGQGKYHGKYSYTKGRDSRMTFKHYITGGKDNTQTTFQTWPMEKRTRTLLTRWKRKNIK